MRRVRFIFAFVLLAALAIADTIDPLQQAWDHTWQGDFDKAIASYQAFAKQNADHEYAPVALFNAASIKMDELGDAKGAQKDFEKLIDKYPGSKWAAEAYCRLGEIALERSDRKAAVQYFQNGLKRLSGENYRMPDFWVNQAVEACQSSLAELHDPVFEIAVYQDLAQFMPPGEAAVNMVIALGEAQIAASNEQDAAATFADLMLTYSTFPQIGQVIAAHKDLVSQYHADFPWEDVERMSGLMTMIRQEQLTEAMDVVKAIEQKYPDGSLMEAAKLAKIIVQLKMGGDFETALDDLEFFISKYAESVWAPLAGEQTEFMDQMVRLEDRLKLNPDDYGTHVEMGWTLLRQRYNRQAEEHFGFATADPDNDIAYLGLGYTYLRMQDNEKCVEAFSTYLKNHPDEGDVYNRVGYAYIQLGNLEKALEAFEHYKDLEPDNPNTHDSYAECLMNLERYDEAIASYQRAIEINPDFTNPYFMLGQIYNTLENFDEALNWYQQYLEKDPAGFQSATAQERIDEISQK
ncbi:tetratricopeptide repeat protein [bacterium]|nr:tetratricopeptide repeat protein [bacterium]